MSVRFEETQLLHPAQEQSLLQRLPLKALGTSCLLVGVLGLAGLAATPESHRTSSLLTVSTGVAKVAAPGRAQIPRSMVKPRAPLQARRVVARAVEEKEPAPATEQKDDTSFMGYPKLDLFKPPTANAKPSGSLGQYEDYGQGNVFAVMPPVEVEKEGESSSRGVYGLIGGLVALALIGAGFLALSNPISQESLAKEKAAARASAKIPEVNKEKRRKGTTDAAEVEEFGIRIAPKVEV